jgi:hypothetical protein
VFPDKLPNVTAGPADIQAGAAAPFEFAVLIEDDLVLAPDFVKYFLSMSRVMRVDPTLYCVSAHNDNAFYGTSWEPESGSLKALDGLGFDFRRGNHFMAPGWMTSREIYRGVVRDMWLDSAGQYAFKEQLHLRNGHWDRFFDSLTGARDCIFPDIPRIIHQGADGFTVSQRAQMELYSNLRLSQLSPLVDYGDLHRLTKDGYVQSIVDFIAGASRLSALEESRSYRLSHLVYIVAAVDSDKDDNWNEVLNGFFGLIGVGGYGGFEGYVKLRGVFQGTVMVRWNNNLILLVGAYSPFLGEAQKLPLKLDFALASAGCFSDVGADRDLPHHLPYYTPLNLSPRACLTSCVHEGFKYAGVQAGMECWCGNSYGKHGQPDVAGTSGACSQQCGPGIAPTALLKAATTSPNKPRAMALLAPPINAKNDPVSCGGAWSNSIYSLDGGAAPNMHEDVLRAPRDALFVSAGAGQSCTEACGSPSVRTKALGKAVRCIEGLFPLLHRSCPILKALVGCTSCVEGRTWSREFTAPEDSMDESADCPRAGTFDAQRNQTSRKQLTTGERACANSKTRNRRGNTERGKFKRLQTRSPVDCYWIVIQSFASFETLLDLKLLASLATAIGRFHQSSSSIRCWPLASRRANRCTLISLFRLGLKASAGKPADLRTRVARL